jgi:COP9 signalosome complex subunit 7
MASNPKFLQFVLLANSVKGAAAADLILKVLEAPGVWVFGEFMEIASIQEVPF